LKPAAAPAFVFEERFSKERMGRLTMAFSSETETGSHTENAPKQESKVRFGFNQNRSGFSDRPGKKS
jgi:hypothetical protein